MRVAANEVWGGISSGTAHHIASRFDAHLYVRAAGGGCGGDVHGLYTAGGSAARLVVADVMGHGPEVAPTSAWLYERFVEALADGDEAGVLRSVNRDVVRRGPHALTTALVLGFDVLEGILSYANAGHLPILFCRDDAMGWRVLWHVDPTTLSGMPLGARPETAYFTRRTVLRPGDRMVLLTDGVVDALGPGDACYGLDRLRALLQDHRHADAASLLDLVVATVQRFAEGRLDHDDVTLVTLGVH